MCVPAHVLDGARPAQLLDDRGAFPELLIGHTDRHENAQIILGEHALTVQVAGGAVPFLSRRYRTTQVYRECRIQIVARLFKNKINLSWLMSDVFRV